MRDLFVFLLHDTILKTPSLTKGCSVCLLVCPCVLIWCWWSLLTCLLLIDTEGKCSHLWGRSVVLFVCFLGYWHLVVANTLNSSEDKGLISPRWFSPHIPSLDSEANYKTRLVMIVGIDCLPPLQHGGYSTGHTLSLRFVVPLWSNCSLLYSAPVGVDDQIDNWDSRPSNPFSHWSPADQARQPWQAAQSSLWLRSAVGAELPRSVHTDARTQTVHTRRIRHLCTNSSPLYTQYVIGLCIVKNQAIRYVSR